MNMRLVLVIWTHVDGKHTQKYCRASRSRPCWKHHQKFNFIFQSHAFAPVSTHLPFTMTLWLASRLIPSWIYAVGNQDLTTCRDDDHLLLNICTPLIRTYTHIVHAHTFRLKHTNSVRTVSFVAHEVSKIYWKNLIELYYFPATAIMNKSSAKLGEQLSSGRSHELSKQTKFGVKLRWKLATTRMRGKAGKIVCTGKNMVKLEKQLYTHLWCSTIRQHSSAEIV